jgi:hypothetical protein
MYVDMIYEKGIPISTESNFLLDNMAGTCYQ